MKRKFFIAVILILFVGIFFIEQNSSTKESIPTHMVADNALSGGKTTVFVTSREAFAKPLANLPTKDLRSFTFGNKMFNTNWVQAPASVTSLDGLGPTFNRVSCSACHFKDGRGRPPLNEDEPMNSMLLRLSIAGKAADGGPMPHQFYGGQLNPFGIYGVFGEGNAKIIYEEIAGTYADGSKYSLRKPIYQFYNMKFGELGEETMFSPRVAPAMHGMGLLEAISEDTILSWADENDNDNDGISGRPNYTPNLEGKKVVGRFGWKSNVATLKQQDAGAALGDIGITTSLNTEENCPEPQTDCKNAIHGGKPEMSDMQLDKMVFYTQTLAPPARRNVDNSQVQLGAEIFVKSKCANCHIPQVTTGKHKIIQLSYQNIQPFTDLLLHDMGDDLADNRPDYEANGNEWRTPPLWGIGLVKVVNQHTNFLHDGRARNIEEAILWHGGEAETAKQSFVQLEKPERESLIKFVNSL
jgi:CxxC motif-containing protein (DUF1111 family)